MQEPAASLAGRVGRRKRLVMQASSRRHNRRWSTAPRPMVPHQVHPSHGSTHQVNDGLSFRGESSTSLTQPLLMSSVLDPGRSEDFCGMAKNSNRAQLVSPAPCGRAESSVSLASIEADRARRATTRDALVFSSNTEVIGWFYISRGCGAGWWRTGWDRCVLSTTIRRRGWTKVAG